jgi:hypothetical protein
MYGFTWWASLHVSVLYRATLYISVVDVPVFFSLDISRQMHARWLDSESTRVSNFFFDTREVQVNKKIT